ncbi:uncharacterized protein LOC125369582 [Ricinus communis]|uniref:uncharacterized protein LOC125369582 n=1 Tax=Ricinus communis TaxID=3988 RepID=UPI00201AA092|nr:uncharacterized protein LOC125369582 [Ricinus communis]
MHDGYKEISTNKDDINPHIREKLEKTKKLVKSYTLKLVVGNKYEVKFFKKSYILDLVGQSCTCRAWELTGLLCCHAIICIHYKREDITKYVDGFYFKEPYLQSYQDALAPLNGSRKWHEVLEAPILPLVFVKQPGRLRRNRRKGPKEERKNAHKMPRNKIKMKCQRCFIFMHKKRLYEAVISKEAIAPEKPKVNFKIIGQQRGQESKAPPM